eukprot:355289-Chlamydomonas_euryale.AAC.4
MLLHAADSRGNQARSLARSVRFLSNGMKPILVVPDGELRAGSPGYPLCVYSIPTGGLKGSSPQGFKSGHISRTPPRTAEAIKTAEAPGTAAAPRTETRPAPEAAPP